MFIKFNYSDTWLAENLHLFFLISTLIFYGRGQMNIRFADMKGQILVDIIVDRQENVIIFKTAQSKEYRLFHDQDCCELVVIEDIVGDLSDILNAPLLIAEERTNKETLKEKDTLSMWTFYELATIKGNVTIRWHGISNGYYSVGVDFVESIDSSKSI